MKHFLTSIAIVLIFGTGLFISEQQRQAQSELSNIPADGVEQNSTERVSVRAAGRIQGRTEEIALRARQDGQIQEILVTEGQWVSKGDVLISLDIDRLAQERDLATALLDTEKAKKERLENGSLASEIETARQEHFAAKARMAGAESAYQRAVELMKSNAISQQNLDDLSASLSSLRALTAAAGGRLQTLVQPPRHEDLLAANAAVRAAEARLEIARTNLEYAQVKAPINGKVLAVNAEVGELARSNSEASLVIMSDTSQLKAVAEIEEFDALRIELGQACHITADGAEGVLGRGEIIKVAPQMNRKQLFSHWAGERSDTYSRRVWIALEESVDLPIGLPVDVFIESAERK